MLRFPYPVEAIVFFSCACIYTYQTLQNEYIYQVVSEQHNYTANSSVEYCSTNQSKTDRDQIVADESSRWSMYANLAYYLPCSVFSLLLTAWSDKIGRKIAIAFPVCGTAIASALQTFIIVYRLPLYWIIVVSFIFGASGAYGALINIGAAYLSDTVKEDDRNRRFTILDVSGSLAGGVVLIGSGYWINACGFIPSAIFITGCAIVSILLIPMMTSSINEQKRGIRDVKDEYNYSESDALLSDGISGLNENYYTSDCYDSSYDGTNKYKKKRNFYERIKVVWSVYTSEYNICTICKSEQNDQQQNCAHDKRILKRRLWRLWFFVVSYSVYMLVVNGVESFRTMFFVSYPVCFTPEMVGLQNGLDNGLVLLDPLVLIFCESVLHLGSQSILLLAILCRMTSTLVMSFAKGAILAFAATSLGIIFNLSTPLMRSQISLLVSSTEQGSALALLSGIENVFNIFSPLVFLYIYPATLYISHGFSWIVATLLLCVPIVLMTIVQIADCRNKIIVRNN